VLSVFATTDPLKRGKVYDVLIGTNGTGTAVTPNALDPAAALATAKSNYSVEPTATGNSSLFNVGVNQRASYRRVAAPRSELVFPATANHDRVLRTRSGNYTGSATGDFMYQEQ
jgi:hypothetical protein